MHFLNFIIRSDKFDALFNHQIYKESLIITKKPKILTSMIFFLISATFNILPIAYRLLVMEQRGLDLFLTQSFPLLKEIIMNISAVIMLKL